MTDANRESLEAPLARLSWRTLEDAEQVFALRLDTVTFGRSTNCDICLIHAEVSRHHAEIHYNGEIYTLLDLRSRNGTFINGRRLNCSCELKDGDCFVIGPYQFRFKRTSPLSAPATFVPQVQDSTTSQTRVEPLPAALPLLEVQDGLQKGVRFELKSRMVIGRQDRAHQWDIILQDRAVSRPQAEIVREAKGFLLTDLKSINGTLVNGAEITQPHLLKDGDVITFGETVMVFRAGIN